MCEFCNDLGRILNEAMAPEPSDREMAVSVLVSMIKDTSERIGKGQGSDNLRMFTPGQAENILIGAGIKALKTLGVTEEEIEQGIGLLVQEGVFRR